MQSPWSLRILAQSPLTLIVGVRGGFWIIPDDAEPLHIGPGDFAVTRGPGHYNVADAPDTQPSVFIHPGQKCRDAEGRSLLDEMTHGVRTWGNAPDGDTLFLVGAYEQLSDISDRLLRALPPVLTVAHDEWDSPLVGLLADEMARDEPGQAAVLDRLIDLLLTAVLKAWFGRRDADSPAWWQHQGDRVVERTLQLMHDRPGQAWTLDRLATEAGASRASLSRRFQALVGEPPMTFLKNWRMAVAADLLGNPHETVATVADKVGYATPFAFSAAFKRVRGLSPHEHRKRSLAHNPDT